MSRNTQHLSGPIYGNPVALHSDTVALHSDTVALHSVALRLAGFQGVSQENRARPAPKEPCSSYHCSA